MRDWRLARYTARMDRYVPLYMKKATDDGYLLLLKTRKSKSRIYKSFQLTGLEIAELLNDDIHKSLYIKLAKEHNPQALLRLAKDVASRRRVKNKGGYFMKLFHKDMQKKEFHKISNS